LIGAASARWITVPALVLLATIALEPARARGDGFDQNVRPLVQKHCLRCRSAEKSKGDVNLAKFADEESLRSVTDLAGVIPLYVTKPVKFDPGTKWVYCQSGINTAARVVEVVCRMPFDEFVERRLFAPLGMKDTTFYLSDAQLSRLTKAYRRTDRGELTATEVSILHGKSPTSRDRFPAANGGLFYTAPDYARFRQMIANGGEYEGRRYLKPESVQLMTSVQTGDLKTGFTPGNGWGLGWCVIREPQGVTSVLSPGTFGHGGAYGTQAWIDSVKKRIYILMIQRADFPNSDASEVRRTFQESANASLAGVR
jgi:CubicO group peptidase (beta-lactamase class C family)